VVLFLLKFDRFKNDFIGRNIGIYNDVFLSFTKFVQLNDPWIITKLNGVPPYIDSASLSFNAELGFSFSLFLFLLFSI
jgi:hypothetical protein